MPAASLRATYDACQPWKGANKWTMHEGQGTAFSATLDEFNRD